jgi:hypothetical protein
MRTGLDAAGPCGVVTATAGPAVVAVLVAIGLAVCTLVVVVVTGTAVTVVLAGGADAVTGATMGVVGTANARTAAGGPAACRGRGSLDRRYRYRRGAVAASGVTIAVPVTLPSVAATWARFLGPSSVRRPAWVIELFAPVTLQVNV